MNGQPQTAEGFQSSNAACWNATNAVEPWLEASAANLFTGILDGANSLPPEADLEQIENVLRQREAQLSSIFQTIPNGILILSPTGRILTANRAAEQILRLKSSALANRTYNDPSWDIATLEGQPFPEEDLPFVRVMRTGKAVYGAEHAITHSDGSRIILSINASPLLNSEGQIVSVVAALNDITERVHIEAERQQAEKALRESQERYRSVIESAAEGIVLQYRNGGIFTCNASAERILGLTADQLRGVTSLDPRWRAVYEDGSPFPGELHPAMLTLQTGEPQSNVTMGIRKPDDTLTWISINTRPMFQPQETQPFAVVVSFFEITDRLQAEAERIKRVQEQSARVLAEEAQEQSAFLAEVSSVLASSLDYEQTLQSVANLAVPYFADWCSVDLLNPDRSISRVAVAHTDPEKVQFGWAISERFPRHLDDAYGISHVMQTGRAEVVPEITDEMLAASVPDPDYLAILQEAGLRSCIIAPLEARGRVLGSISFIYAESERRYSSANLSLAEDLARRAAIAIDNASLFQETQKAKQAAEAAAKRTARLQTVTAALSESLTPLQVAEVVVEQSMAALEADSALVVLVTPDQRELEIIKAVGYTDALVEKWRRFSINSPVPLAEAVRTGQPVWIETRDERIARYPHLASIYNGYSFHSWMSLPLVTEGRSVGGMLLNFKDFKQLSQDDRDFILALSRQCAQAISRAQLYEAERQARADAEQANRVKDEFLAVLSHELRSPLNPILGWAGLLRTGRLTAEKTTQAVEIIERNAKLQVQLIEDLLDVSRILRGKLSLSMAPVRLVPTIEAALETVRLAAEAKGLQVETTLSLDNHAVLGDAARIQQIVWNLLFNAVKFTPTDGRVEVRLEYVGAQAEIQVIDTGKGIHPDFLPYIFDTFRQADSTTTRTFGGLGLGLAIVRHLVELHGGTVHAASPGEDLGATLTVCFPLLSLKSEQNAAEPTDAQPHVNALPLDGLTLLIVDDDPDTRDVITFALEQAGALVTATSSVAEALETLKQSTFDLLASDIGMPDQDGYALIRQVRAWPVEQGGRIPAIALTAYAGEQDQQQALSAGFNQHLSKPIDLEQLISAITQLAHPAS